MTRAGRWVLSMLLWVFGGTLYFLLEVTYKTVTMHPERISWTMLVLATFLTIPVERCGAECPWGWPLALQAALCTVAVTGAELAAGVVLNLWLGLDVWDYSGLPGNLLGQICPQFTAAWFVLCIVFIVIFDWLRYAVAGGDRPTYTFLENRRE